MACRLCNFSWRRRYEQVMDDRRGSPITPVCGRPSGIVELPNVISIQIRGHSFGNTQFLNITVNQNSVIARQNTLDLSLYRSVSNIVGPTSDRFDSLFETALQKSYWLRVFMSGGIIRLLLYYYNLTLRFPTIIKFLASQKKIQVNGKRK